MKLPLVAAAMMALSAPSQAALFNFTGTITNHSDVVQVSFTTYADATDVRVWTDSFKSGLNFDPITALWRADGTRLGENDDNASIDPATQTIYDSGFSLPFLAAGSYLFTIAAYNNWALGTLLSDGFTFDNQTPIPIGEWNQPANGTGKGNVWSVWLDGVDVASVPGNTVPEPSVLALLAVGALGGLAMRRRKAG
ncbi:PEP-CTERM sorting domain-containing protein [Pseudothauera nasutitermitis]|uniref:PEP-CTERM sorting domain-containing protein n=1 Tax=Pseudothauera nasutitermitis TaxID=2565930 RepID=A0A4S4B1U1_9RHOO|nr:DVUA0089 family protein [Pseudothauera nasutitermitis]THF66135.1 PEP-CTERM sorting domain-containing protein [Pseudothauera nasutitermitis]